jgi:hypothetical protein
MARKKTGVTQDLSSFMAILIMTIGALVTLLVSNTLIIISNPENTQITSIITSSLYLPPPLGGTGSEGGAPFPQGNKVKEPLYLDVHRDRVILYPGEEVLPVRDLERTGNILEARLADIETKVDREYVVLLVRPRSAVVARRLAKAVRDRGIDLGVELYEEGRQIRYEYKGPVQKPVTE